VSEQGLLLEDLGSRNGTFINGGRVTGGAPLAASDVLRVGESLFLARTDIGPYFGSPRRDRRRTRDRAADAAGLCWGQNRGRRAQSLAETGSGKEMVARAFHDCFSPKGPFVPLNCAALPATLAEGMLFGVERGADSGATASRAGYLAQGDGGVSAARPSPARTLAARPVRIAPVRSLSDPGGIDAP